MIRLLSFEVQGFQAENRKAKVEFATESSVSVIYGDNGCGKTTLLKLLHGVLNRETSMLASDKVSKVIIEYSVDNADKVTVVVNQIKKLDDEGNLLKIDYDWEELTNSELAESKSLSLGVERGVTTQSLKVDASDIFRFSNHPKYRSIFNKMDIHEFSEDLSNFIRSSHARKVRTRRDGLSLERDHIYLQSIKMSNIESLLIERYRQARSVATERIQNALFDTLSVVIDPTENQDVNKLSIPDDFTSLVMDNRDRLIEALDDGVENNFKGHVTNILSNASDLDTIEVIKENNILCQLILNMINELEIEQQLLSSVNTLVDTFNLYLVGDKKLVVSTHEIYVEIDNQPHSINALSSGERHILTFLSLVVISGRDRDFLIIDEPEISLNIKWQRTLMSLLRELVPLTQIIVASHSSLIAKKIPKSLVKLAPEVMDIE